MYVQPLKGIAIKYKYNKNILGVLFILNVLTTVLLFHFVAFYSPYEGETAKLLIDTIRGKGGGG